MALPHTALQVTPALTGFPSTSNAVSTQQTALSHTALQVTPALAGFPSTSNAVSTQHTALSHTALQVTPALAGFSSTSNAVSTQHTALSVRCHAHFGLQTFSSASLHNKQALCVLQEKPSFSAIYKHGLLPHCSHTVPGAKNYFGDPQKYSSFIYSAFGHVSDSRSHYYQLKIISCMPINKGKRH